MEDKSSSDLSANKARSKDAGVYEKKYILLSGISYWVFFAIGLQVLKQMQTQMFCIARYNARCRLQQSDVLIVSKGCTEMVLAD